MGWRAPVKHGIDFGMQFRLNVRVLRQQKPSPGERHCGRFMTGDKKRHGLVPHFRIGQPFLGILRILRRQQHGKQIAMIGSFGMALRYSFGFNEAADKLEAAIASVLDAGLRTADISSAGRAPVSTAQMGDAIVAALWPATPAPHRTIPR